MLINTQIPGQMAEEELNFIASLAQRVPPSGRILELGSLFGRSSWTWAKNTDPSATVYCVDPWKRESWIGQLEEKFNTVFGIDTFHRNTSDCDNIVALPGYSPDDFGDWSLDLDIYFDDSVHANPIFRRNLDFWIRHVKPGGIMCGHDFSPQFPDIVAEVRALAERLGSKLEVVGTIWKIDVPVSYRRTADSDHNVAATNSTPLKFDVPPDLPRSVGTMMKPKELELLYSFARNHYIGAGEIIDIGPFLGSSTIAFANGLRDNPAPFSRAKRIYSYDQFLYESYVGFDPFLNQDHLPTGSFFPHFYENIKPYIENVFVSPGDLIAFGWNKNPVEILFIDAAKSTKLNNHIVRNFFGSLIPGRSAVVQRDYFYYDCPWVIQTMEHYSPFFVHEGSVPGATAYLRCTQKIPEILTRTPLEVACNPKRQRFLLDQAINRVGGNQKSIVELSRAYFLSSNGAKDECAEEIDRISAQSAIQDEWRDALTWSLKGIRQRLENL